MLRSDWSFRCNTKQTLFLQDSLSLIPELVELARWPARAGPKLKSSVSDIVISEGFHVTLPSFGE